MQAAPPPPQVDRPPPPPPSIPHASSTIPWSAHEIEIAPPPSYWAFNPSVIRTPDGRWLCAVRCANYHLDADAGGKATVPVAGPVSPSGEPLAPVPLGRVMPKTVYNRSFMVTLDPRSLRAIADVEMHELDGLPIPEVAEAMKIPVATAYSRLRIGRAELTAAVLRLKQGAT